MTSPTETVFDNEYQPERVSIDKSTLYEILNRLKAIGTPVVEYHADQIVVAQRAITEMRSRAKEAARVLRREMNLPAIPD